MAIIKCKMCGGDVELAADKTFGTCEYCGSTMTFPKVDDEQRAAAFNRGNHFRRIGEFDKALAVYERIVREDDTDAEAHWCCALCRFGIEYVEDPATYEYLPTCHRASFDSFLEDVDYLAAVAHSDGLTKRQYQKDAAKIAEVQRGILATSQNEEPFDVFICYKESDENGQRTRDSLMAQDVYYQLTDQGYRVFFSRITLEDMAGKQYEPYIFAALNSAKVMIVIGTKAEYMNAVWVKNEWSRFLAMMKKDHSKLLLPCYRDMDPYDMPEQLSVLQSYDMSKIGFIQDLTRGIKKVLEAEKKPEIIQETVITGGNTNTAPLLKRIFIFLEDGDWQAADEYAEKVLDIDPENAQAYLGKLMAELKVHKQEDIPNCGTPFDQINSYQKVLRYGDQQLGATLASYAEHVKIRNEEQRIENIYLNATRVMNNGSKEADYLEAARLFNSICHIKNAADLASACLAKAEEYRAQEELHEKAKIYNKASEMISGNLESPELSSFERLYGVKPTKEYCVTKEDLQKAADMFRSIPDFQDALQQAEECERQIQKLQLEKAYVAAERLSAAYSTASLEKAIKAFESIIEYNDSREQIEKCKKRLNEVQKWEDEQREYSLIRQRRASGLCQHCGGELKGVFSKKCENCGKPKDY